MKHIIGYKDYKAFAGPDWPSYEDMINGVKAADPEINAEIENFKQIMTQSYEEIVQHGEQLAEDNKQRQQQIFFDKQYKKQHCTVPWETLGIHSNGDVFVCSSPSWIPKFVGNIFDHDDIFEILNSDLAQSIRYEILEGRYLYCNNKICSFFSKIDKSEYRYESEQEEEPLLLPESNQLLVNEIPKNLIFDFDYTCNFKCPSCRTEVINTNKHHVIRPINDKIADYIKYNIIDRIEDQPINIRWCGGEPFISQPYLDIMDHIANKNKPNIKNIIQTNGSFLKKKSDLITKLLPNISEMRISFDAATPETYAKTRVNGNWETLIENVIWIKDLIDKTSAETKISADYVVQLANYEEIPDFVKLCNELGIKHIEWQKMWNWGTWNQDEFDKQNVYTDKHPKFGKVVYLLKQENQMFSKI